MTLLSLLLLSLAGAPSGETLSLGRFGKFAVMRPEGAPKSVAILLSGEGGWKGAPAELGAALQKEGALVLGVDTPRYLHSYAGQRSCIYPAGDLEALAQFAEKKLAMPEYLHPVLVGFGSSSAIAYASLAQSPIGTFLGALSIGFCPQVKMAEHFCPQASLTRGRSKDGGSEVVKPPKGTLPGAFVALAGEQDATCPVAEARSFIANAQGASAVALPEVGHELAHPERWQAAFLAAYAGVAAPPEKPKPAAPREPEPPPSADVPKVDDLPLVEVREISGQERPTLALLISGDGGWAGIDRSLAAAMNAHGVPVIGLDTLRYFWNRRTPEETAKAVERILRHYLAAWHKDDVVLLGYSRGADMMPFIANLLPDDLKAKTRLLGLVAAEKNTDFEVHVGDLFGTSGASLTPVLPQFDRLKLPVLCVYGDEDAAESLCPAIAGRPLVQVLKLSGGHHFGGNYDAVAKAVVDALPK